MDFSKVKKTRIALKFAYIGKNYDGLVIQINTENTIEEKLFTAMKICCLIDPDQDGIKSTVYTRCGRTDKGVSALSNVCSLNVRYLPDGDYCHKINACLPHDIRVLGYADVSP
jgi:tRNA pseudouridine38/39 synthase